MTTIFGGILKIPMLGILGTPCGAVSCKLPHHCLPLKLQEGSLSAPVEILSPTNQPTEGQSFSESLIFLDFMERISKIRQQR